MLLLLKIAHVGFYSARQYAAVKGTGVFCPVGELPTTTRLSVMPPAPCALHPSYPSEGEATVPRFVRFIPDHGEMLTGRAFLCAETVGGWAKNQCHKTFRPFALMYPLQNCHFLSFFVVYDATIRYNIVGRIRQPNLQVGDMRDDDSWYHSVFSVQRFPIIQI